MEEVADGAAHLVDPTDEDDIARGLLAARRRAPHRAQRPVTRQGRRAGLGPGREEDPRRAPQRSSGLSRHPGSGRHRSAPGRARPCGPPAARRHGRHPPERRAGQGRVATLLGGVGRPREPGVEGDQVFPLAHTRRGERSRHEVTDTVRDPGRDHVLTGRVVPNRTDHGVRVVRAHPQSRRASRLPIDRTFCSPATIRATPAVILRVTKVSGRRGDSWLKRMQLEACSPRRR